MLRMLLLLLLPLAILWPPGATAETQDGSDGGVLIPEDFVPPAAHSDSGACKANRRDRSRPQIQVRPKSHHQVHPVTDTAMALREPRPALLLPHILLSGSLGLIGERNEYEQFKRKHVDFPKTSNTQNETYCNYMMKKRNMTNNTYCKPFNTFIHDTEQAIKAICKKKGILDKDNIYKSNTAFSLTVCKLDSQNVQSGPVQSCTYEGKEKTSKIRVACNNNHLPVHFENTTPAAPMSLEKIQTQMGRTSTGLPRTHMECKQGAALKPQLGPES
ncbi:brain ribonuclease-like isoform X2 [Mauremys reevesii]|uniref:brain ribonuclease-like isoform X2 n=1 Tax=Mauremys reevesii TaxID=260615 RepID=UPI0019401ACE|nr:brain ribonuclease-like isoform X2 [Mauremys reevesii]